jgi:membrane fusion protein (multidrug efflux system)
MKGTLFLFGILLASCGGGEKHGERGKHGKHGKKDKIVDRRILIEPVTVANGSVAKHLMTTGTLESEAQADITPEASGVVTRVLADEGDTVEAGQLLAVLASPGLEAGADRSKVELQQARRRAQQAERLHEQGAISDTELLEARETLQTAKASHREATRSRGFANIVSPISGTVAVRDVRVGELAGSGSRAYQVVDLDRLRVIAQLPEKDLGLVSPGLHVVLQGAYNPDLRAEGRVDRVSPVVDPNTGTVRVTVAVNGNTSTLRPGQFVKVRVEVDRHDDVIAIPKGAVIWQDGAPIAWRIVDKDPDEEDKNNGKNDEPSFFEKWFADETEDDKAESWAEVPRRQAEKTALTLGFMDSDRAEITAGLSLGDLIVSVGGEHIRQAAEIKLPGDPNPIPADDEANDDATDNETENGEEE